MAVNGEIHVPAATLSGRETPVPTGYGVGYKIKLIQIWKIKLNFYTIKHESSCL